MLDRFKKVFSFKAVTVRGTIVKNFGWLIAGNVGSRLLKALIVVYAARRLGVEGYGVFSYALGLAGFFVFFKNIGVDGILTREIAKKPEKDRQYFSTALGIEIFLVAITFLLIILAAPFFSGVEKAIVLLPLAAFILIFDDIRDIFIAFFRGKEKMEMEALIVVIGNVALLICGFLILRLWPTSFAFAAATAAASLIGVCFAAFLLRNFLRDFSAFFSKELVKPILKSAWPIAVGGLAGAFLFNVDIIMLGWWRGAAEVGLYSAAQRIVGLLAIFSSFVATTVFPTLSRLAESDKNKVEEVFAHSLKMIFIVALPLVAGGLILKTALIDLVFGPAYAAAAPIFGILLISILAVHPMAVFINILFVFDKQSKMIGYALTASLLNIALNFILIPRFGMMGAAVATAFSFVVYGFFLWRSSREICHFPLISGLVKPVVASILMAAAVFFLQAIGLPILVNIFLSSVFYFICLFFMKEKTMSEVFSFLNSSFRNRIKSAL